MSKLTKMLNRTKTGDIYYHGGEASFDFAHQTNLVPNRFMQIRDLTKAWHYKLTNIMLVLFVVATLYGLIKGYNYYSLRSDYATLQAQLNTAKLKERQDLEMSRSIYGQIVGVESKYALAATQPSLAEALLNLAKDLPAGFFVQNMAMESEPLMTAGGKSTTRISPGTPLDTFGFSLKLNGRIIGLGEEAVETKLRDAFTGLPGFDVTSSQSLSDNDNIELGFQLRREITFDFSKKEITE